MSINNPTNPDDSLPLKGMRILDITVVWAGPYSTMHLADWGAEVIRIESTKYFAATTRGQMARPPQGVVEGAVGGGMGYAQRDAGERPWNRHAIFNAHGRNKLSMTVDLTKPEGQEVFENLVRKADGLIENNLPQSMEKQGITWERLSKINPKLVMIRMPAFGLEGPYKNYRTWGNHMESISGHPLIRTYPDLSPEYAPAGVPADAAGGVGAALAMLMGRRYVRRNGKGLMIEAPTAENFVPLLGDFVMDYSMNGRLWNQMGNEHWNLAPHNVYRTQGEDAWVTIVCWDNEQWAALCGLMSMDSLIEDERFKTNDLRYENRKELDAIISAWTIDRQASWIMDKLQLVKVPSGIVMNERDSTEDRHLHERKFFTSTEHPEAGTHKHVMTPFKSRNHQDVGPRRAAPLLGEDNEYVYKEVLGYSEEQYKKFEEQGHIGMDFDPSIQ
jgi:crotonobetainyl-CoA:carnitine CoA-transferase CaiB-like acyl-CoA transferase